MLQPDMKLNEIPAIVKNIHLIAICGTAMGALALMLKDLGYHVTGSDTAIYPPMSDYLTRSGINIQEGFAAEHIAADVDLVVVGNAVSVDNAECQAMMGRCLHFCSMPQALNGLVAKGKQVLMVTGTHGKTTTTSMLAWVLESAGLAPSFFIGGILNNFGKNYQLGAGQYIVIEGDEYDTAFFDKKSKFFHYTPSHMILTSVEFDHADIFADFAAVRATFAELLEKLPQDSLVLGGESQILDELLPLTSAKVLRYGTELDGDWRLGEFSFSAGLANFEVYCKNQLYHKFAAPIMGKHNLTNALAVIGVLASLGLTKEQIAQGLLTFKGIKRRQEVRGEKQGIIVLDDFAHHPTAVKVTIDAVRAFYPHKTLVAVFEPRTNTSMRDIFQKDYAEVFFGADTVVISDVPLKHKVPQGMRFSSQKLVQDLRQRHLNAHVFSGPDEIIPFLQTALQPNSVVLIMSNGGFGNIHQRLLDAL